MTIIVAPGWGIITIILLSVNFHLFYILTCVLTIDNKSKELYV